MIIKTYKCDACGEEVKDKDITIIADFPRRKYEYARSALGTKICGFETTVFDETHFCPICLHKLLNWTKIIEDD